MLSIPDWRVATGPIKKEQIAKPKIKQKVYVAKLRTGWEICHHLKRTEFLILLLSVFIDFDFLLMRIGVVLGVHNTFLPKNINFHCCICVAHFFNFQTILKSCSGSV